LSATPSTAGLLTTTTTGAMAPQTAPHAGVVEEEAERELAPRTRAPPTTASRRPAARRRRRGGDRVANTMRRGCPSGPGRVQDQGPPLRLRPEERHGGVRGAEAAPSVLGGAAATGAVEELHGGKRRSPSGRLDLSWGGGSLGGVEGEGEITGAWGRATR
jgi:hypothetical protein